MGGRYSQTSVTSVIYDNNIKIQGTHSQKMFNNNSQITLMYRYDLQNLISGSRNWTISIFFKYNIIKNIFYTFEDSYYIPNQFDVKTDFMSVGFDEQNKQGFKLSFIN